MNRLRVFEMRFAAREGVYDAKIKALLERLRLQLILNGLILEGATQSYMDGGTLVWRIVAQDDDAIAEDNMTYNTREALAAVIKRCEGLPQVIPREECADLPHCSCKRPTTLIMQSPAEWQGTPVLCLDCGGSVPLYRIERDREQRDFAELLHWRKLRRGFLEQVGEKLNTGYAYDMLKDGRSPLSVQGRRLSSVIQSQTNVLTLYPLLSRFEQMPDRCPCCGSDWRNPYTGAIPYERFCRHCRLVLTQRI